MSIEKKLEQALITAIKVVRHSRNVLFSITAGELRAEGVEAELEMEEMLGKKKYEELCAKAFKK